MRSAPVGRFGSAQTPVSETTAHPRWLPCLGARRLETEVSRMTQTSSSRARTLTIAIALGLIAVVLIVLLVLYGGGGGSGGGGGY